MPVFQVVKIIAWSHQAFYRARILKIVNHRINLNRIGVYIAGDLPSSTGNAYGCGLPPASPMLVMPERRTSMTSTYGPDAPYGPYMLNIC